MEENTSSVFMETVVKKMEEQDKQFTLLEEKVDHIPDNTEELQELKASLRELITEVRNARFPVKAVQDFSAQLAAGIAVFSKPVENKVLHHHYIPKLIWGTIGLLLAFVLSCSGWYMAADKLSQHQAADTKYRYLKLISDGVSTEYLRTLDSLYRSGYAMEDSVIQWEEDLQKAIELSERLQEKSSEGGKLKETLDAINKKIGARKKQK
jgi:hypothetical protein